MAAPTSGLHADNKDTGIDRLYERGDAGRHAAAADGHKDCMQLRPLLCRAVAQDLQAHGALQTHSLLARHQSLVCMSLIAEISEDLPIMLFLPVQRTISGAEGVRSKELMHIDRGGHIDDLPLLQMLLQPHALTLHPQAGGADAALVYPRAHLPSDQERVVKRADEHLPAQRQPQASGTNPCPWLCTLLCTTTRSGKQAHLGAAGRKRLRLSGSGAALQQQPAPL